jgi:3-oxoacyl-[acyl-carrier protein] reductase
MCPFGILMKKLASKQCLNLVLLSEHFFCKVNVASMEDCVSAASATVAKFGRIDVLINNAGITRDASLTKMDAQQWQQVMDVNLTGVFNATKSVCDYMIQAEVWSNY